MSTARTIVHTRDLMSAIEKLFPYAGSIDRAFVDIPLCGRVVPQTFAYRTKRAEAAEHRLLQAMYESFSQAQHTLGDRSDVYIMWRREPHFITDDSGDVILRMRAALIDNDGQLRVSCLPEKVEGMTSKMID